MSFSSRALPTDIPTHWYNIIADLPIKPPPPLHPKTFAPLQPQDLSHLFPDELIKQETSNERFIVIPDEVVDVYRLWRPTPLIRFFFKFYCRFCKECSIVREKFICFGVFQSQEVGETTWYTRKNLL